MQFIWQHPRSGASAGHASGGVKHDYAKEQGGDVPSPASQKPEEGSKKNLERTEAQLGEELDRDKMKVRVEGGRKRTDIALALREEESQAKLISETKLDVPLFSQPEAVRTAFLVAIEYEVFPLLVNAGIPKEQLFSIFLKTPSSFGLTVATVRQHNPEKFAYVDRDRTSSEGFKKIHEAFQTPSCALTQSLLGNEAWATIVQRAGTRFTQAKALRDTPAALWSQTKEISTTTLEWIRTHPGQTIKIVTSVAAATVGIVWLVKKIVGKLGESTQENAAGGEGKKESRFSKWMKRILFGGGATAGSVGALYVLSKIIPGGDKLRSWVDDFVKEKVKGKVSEGIEKLDKVLHFSEAKNWVIDSAKKYNIPLDEWVKKMDLSEIAKEMGITSDPMTWIEYIGLGGGAILIYKWAGKKGLLINAGLYLLLLRKGKDSPLGKALLFGAHEFDEARIKLLGRAKQKMPGLDLIIGDAFDDFRIEDYIETFLEWLKEHPAEALLAANALIYFRAYIVKVVLTSGRFIGKHPLAASAVIAAFWFGRKKFAKDVIEIIYDNPESPEAQGALRSVDSILWTDRSKPDTLLERQVPAFVQSIVEDPIHALQKINVIKAFQNGDFSLGIDVTGAGLLFLKGVNIPIQVAKLSKEVLFTSLPHVYSAEYEGNRAWATTIIGVETIILGSMAWQGFGAYRTVIETADTIPRAVIKGLKTLVPGTKEWRFIFRSVLEAPVVAALKIYNTTRIFSIQRQLQKLRALASEIPPDLEKIEKISDKLSNHDLFQDYRTARRNLVGSHFKLKVLHDLDQARKSVDSINDAAKKARYASPELRALKLEEIKISLKTANDELGGIHVWIQGFFKRTQLLFAGKFREAFALPESLEDLRAAEKEAAAARKPIEVGGELFKNADGTFKPRADMEADVTRLRSEIGELPNDNLYPKKVERFHVDEAELRSVDATVRAEKIAAHAAELEALEKGTTARFNQTVEGIVAEAKAQKLPLTHPSITAKLEKVDADLLIPFAEKKQTYIDVLNSEYKRLPRNLRTAPLQAQLRRAVEGVEGTRLTRFVKAAKGRAKMMVVVASAMFLTDQIIHRNDAERDFHQIWTELGPELKQLLLDVLPFVGTASNIYSAFSGKELCTPRDVSGAWDRASNAIWGAVGLAGDVITVVGLIPSGGGSLAANAVLRLTKAAKAGSKTAVKLLKMWPRIEKIADRLGGWYEFGKKVTHYMKLDSKKVLHGLHRIQHVGTLAGTTLLIGGLASHLYYGFVDNKKEIAFASDIATPGDEGAPEENQGAKEKDAFIEREAAGEESRKKAA